MKLFNCTKLMMILFSGILLFAHSSVVAVPPDFNADRRVNIKCPCKIDYDYEGQFELDGFKNTLRRLYHELDKNLKASAREALNNKYGQGYAFSDNPSHGNFFVCHAKAFFPSGSLDNLVPQKEIAFQEVFYITEIDWDQQRLTIVRQKDKKKFTIGVPDFEKAFLWYNDLLDKHKAYIPVYGFLSLPGEADEFPTIWNSWKSHKTDTATPPESLVDYDFYKILDYRDGYYLLGKDFNELDYRDNIEDFGIIGWVEKKYITLWRSRLYYHPLQRVRFFHDKNDSLESKETEGINSFYVEHVYLKERLFNDIVEKLDQDSLHQFYTHFGFPQLGQPEYVKDKNYTKVFIPGTFTPRIMKLLSKSLKSNLNTFFLLDVSQSMEPFADYVKSFNKSVRDMRREGIGLRMNRIFTYRDIAGSSRDIEAEPDFVRVKRPDSLRFVEKSVDYNYAEPLIRSFTKILHEIESLQAAKKILPLQAKLLFVITDAGANDATKKALIDLVKKTKDLNLKVYFVYPDRHGVKHPSKNLDDTPDGAYSNLEKMMAYFEANNSEDNIIFRKFQFETESLQSAQKRQKDFTKQHVRLLDGVKTYLDHVFKEAGVKQLPGDVILYFSDEKLLKRMQKWSDRRIQVLNHVVRYIEDVDSSVTWEERIAIPAKPVGSFLRAIKTQDDISLSDLKKLVIINSLVSVDDIEQCRKIYDSLKPLIEKKTFKSADAIFYKALTNKDSDQEPQWNIALGEDKGPLGEYISKRGFYLNSFNQAVQKKFMYLKVGELYLPE